MEDEDIVKHIGSLLIQQGITISTAESCTGGLIAYLLTTIPGASRYFISGCIVYSDKAKIESLNIPVELIYKYGAVSRETAEQMAISIREKSGANLGIAVTGIAGPSGGSREKPVGTVYIALSSERGVICEHHLFLDDRDTVRKKTATAALKMILDYIKF